MGFLPEKGDGRYNFIIGILNGVIFSFGSAFMDSTTGLPVFIKRYTTSDTLVGLASSLQRAGWLLPQLFIAGYLEGRSHKLPVYLYANAVRMGMLWLFVGFLWGYGTTYPNWVIGCFLALIGVGGLAGGVAGLPFTDIVGKVIPRRHTGMFYAIRFFFGAGVLSILAGVMVNFFLGVSSPFVFPENYGVIFGLAALLMSIGVFITGFMREPSGHISSTRRTALSVIREIPQLLRGDVNFKRLLVVQVMASGIGFSLPFYVVYAREAFGVSESSVGLFLIVQTVGAGISNLIWGRLSARQGNRQVILGTVICSVLVPLLALMLWGSFGDVVRSGPTWWKTAAFLPIFFLMGASTSGTFIGFVSYLLDIAPEGRRPTYVGITNTVMGIAALFPALGGALADTVHFQGVFAVSAIFVVISLILCRNLKVIHNES